MIRSVGLVVSLLLLSCGSDKKVVPHVDTNDQSEVIFQEDFNAASLDMTKWSYALGDGCPELCGWGNQELQRYTDSNHQLVDGNLIIIARPEASGYTSTRILTKDKFEFTYGRVEARARVEQVVGSWPAIWTLGANIDEVGWPACGEIDILEHVGRRPDEVFTSLHTSSSHGDTENSVITRMPDLYDGFHIYGMTWTEDAIAFDIDGQEVYRYAPEVKTPENWPYNKPQYLLINLAIGGKFGGPVQADQYPTSFVVDYVRVTK